MKPIAPKHENQPRCHRHEGKDDLFEVSEKDTHRYNNYYQGKNNIAREIIDKGLADDASETALGDETHSFGSVFIFVEETHNLFCVRGECQREYFIFFPEDQRIIEFVEADNIQIVHRKRYGFFLQHIKERCKGIGGKSHLAPLINNEPVCQPAISLRPESFPSLSV